MARDRPIQDPFAPKATIFRKQGGMLRMSEALKLGINRKSLYGMRESSSRWVVGSTA